MSLTVGPRKASPVNPGFPLGFKRGTSAEGPSTTTARSTGLRRGEISLDTVTAKRYTMRMNKPAKFVVQKWTRYVRGADGQEVPEAFEKTVPFIHAKELARRNLGRPRFGFNRIEDERGFDEATDYLEVEKARNIVRRVRRFQHYLEEVKPAWKIVDTIHFADNSVEVVEVDMGGNRRQRMTTAPHGDACF